jgi:hypothetical protein
VCFERVEVRELTRPIVIAQFKMEDACILCNILEIFEEEK